MLSNIKFVIIDTQLKNTNSATKSQLMLINKTLNQDDLFNLNIVITAIETYHS